MQIDLFDGKPRLDTPPLLVALAGIAAVMLITSVWMVFNHAPTERVMGFVQKIFYFHVPSAWTMFLATGMCALGSVMYLLRRTDKWDRVSDAGIELAILFGVMVMITGPLWARKAWGTFWVWDVRLTSSLVLILTLVACKIVRGYAGPQAKQVSAGLAVFAVINSVFVYYSVDLWRHGTHPPKIPKSEMNAAMYQTWMFCALTFVVLFVCLFWIRLRQGKLENALDRLYMRAGELGIEV